MAEDRKAKRSSLEIKKEILNLLKSKEMTLRLLEKKVDTNPNTIRTQIKELEHLGFVEVIKHEKSEHTGRPFTTVKLIR
jgi:predicted ArsR family transcriptional regulator